MSFAYVQGLVLQQSVHLLLIGSFRNNGVEEMTPESGSWQWLMVLMVNA